MTEYIEKIIRRSSRGTAIFLPKIYKENLSQIEKLAQIGQISTGIIHDLISPITALNLQLELLNNDKLKDSRYINSIRESLERVEDYSKLIKEYISNNQKNVLLDLNKTIDDSLKLISYKAIKENIQIQFIRRGNFFVKTKPIFIYQIIISLISNAIESYRENDINRKIIIKLENINKKISLEIRDFGRGIENIKKIFSPFYTTKKDMGGTGIGLSSVKYIVEEELLGKITVQSEIDKGSVFRITI